MDIPEGNFLVDCRAPHAELMAMPSRTVWQSHLPLTAAEWDALDVPPGFIRIGLGTGVMDEHYFRQSPGESLAGPVAEQVIDGRRFIHCANPPADGGETPVPDGPQLLRVDKHHSLIFAPDRVANILCLPGGKEYIQVIESSPGGGGILQKGPAGEPSVLPTGWSIRTETMTARTIVHLPNPTEAWFFKDGSSYQGPVYNFNDLLPGN